MNKSQVYNQCVEAILSNPGDNLKEVAGNGPLERIATLASSLVKELTKELEKEETQVQDLTLSITRGMLSNPNTRSVNGLSCPLEVSLLVKDCLKMAKALSIRSE